MNEQNNLNQEKLYLTVRQLSEKQPSFQESSIRYLIFHEKTNGFSKVIKRIGTKILIDYPAFLSWVESQGSNNSGGKHA